MYINNKKVGVFFMISKQVLSLLKITRQTLTRFVNEGKIKIEVLENGFYNYDDEDVYKILSNGVRDIISLSIHTSEDNKKIKNYKGELSKENMRDLLDYKIKTLKVEKSFVDNTLILLCEQVGTQLEVIEIEE